MIFSTQYRLQSKEDYSKVFNQPKFIKHQKHLMLLAAPNDLQHARLGLAIAKKHVKRAVDRSRIKRILRETFRARLNSLPALDMVFLAKLGIHKQNRQSLRLSADRILEELK